VIDTEKPKPPPNPNAVRYVEGRGWFVWSSFREKAISKDFDTEGEAERFLAGLRVPRGAH
jgi:hypothetical protein